MFRIQGDEEKTGGQIENQSPMCYLQRHTALKDRFKKKCFMGKGVIQIYCRLVKSGKD